MKKQYIVPFTEVEDMEVTDLLALSVPLDGETQIGEDEILVNEDDNLWID